ncbi:MAG: MoaD/ThiS family protein [Candidatus Bathyarchaeia archaeon]
MKIRVRAFGDLMALLGKESTVELRDEARFKDLVFTLGEKTGSAKKGFLGRYNVTGPNLVILLNGRNIHALEKLDTALKDGDVVTLLPPVVGG